MSDQFERTPKPTSIVSVDDVAIGALLAGKYRILRVLGQGGMGIVVEAEHARLGDHVAIKFLATAHQGGEARERFEREARASVRMRTGHVARVRDIGELDTGQAFIVMELLDGHHLGDYVAQVALEPEAIVDLALQCCEALAEAHALGIIHRDIKPANLFVTHDGERRILKLLDFGVATGPIDDLQITGTGVVIGTPSYMCPEQMRSSRAAEPHWDLWSLGVVLYEVFEGVLPFERQSFAELAVAVLTEPPRAMTRTPPTLQPVLARCLAKHASSRFLEAGELAEALAPHGTPEQAARTLRRITRTAGVPAMNERRPISGPTVVTSTGQTELATPAPVTPTPQPLAVPESPPMTSAPAIAVEIAAPPAETPRSHRTALAIACVMAIGIGVAVWFALQRSPAAVAPDAGLDAVVVDGHPADSAPDGEAPDAEADAEAPDAEVPPDAALDDAATPAKLRRTPDARPAVSPDAAEVIDAWSPEELMKGRS